MNIPNDNAFCTTNGSFILIPCTITVHSQQLDKHHALADVADDFGSFIAVALGGSDKMGEISKMAAIFRNYLKGDCLSEEMPQHSINFFLISFIFHKICEFVSDYHHILIRSER